MFLDTLARRFTSITQNVAFVGVVAMLLLVGATVADVLMRWLFSKPIVGLNEIVGMGMGVAVAATFPSGAIQRVNLTIELLDNFIGRRALGWLKVSAHALLLLFYALLAWNVGLYAAKLQARGAGTVFLQIPTAPFIWAVATFLVIATLAQIIVLFIAVRAALAGEREPKGWVMGGSATKDEARRDNDDLGKTLVAGALVIAALVALVFVFMQFQPEIGRAHV